MQLHSFSVPALLLLLQLFHSLTLAGPIGAARSSGDAIKARARLLGESPAHLGLRNSDSNRRLPQQVRSEAQMSCRPLTLQDITSALTDFQLARLINYTDTELLARLRPGMRMFDLDTFQDGADPSNFNRTASRWRVDVGYWASGGSASDTPGSDGEIGSASAPGRRAGSFAEDPTWYWSAVTPDEMDDLGYVPAQVCLDTASAQLEIVDEDECASETFDAREQPHKASTIDIYPAHLLQTTSEFETSPAAAAGLHAIWNGVVRTGANSTHSQVALARLEVSDETQPRSQTSSSSSPHTIQLMRRQDSSESCTPQVKVDTCASRLRLKTPLTLIGQLHLRSSPACLYNRDAAGECKNDLLLDLGKAMEGFVSDAFVVQRVDATVASTRAFRVQCADGNASTPDVDVTELHSTKTGNGTKTSYGHTMTSFALTKTVAEATATITLDSAAISQPTVTRYANIQDVARTTIFTASTTLTPAVASIKETATTTVTRRPHASSTYVRDVVRTGTAIVRTSSTVTITNRVVETRAPTLCLGARKATTQDVGVERAGAEEYPVTPRKLVTFEKRRTPNGRGGEDGPVVFLPNATRTVVEALRPTTVTATGSTTTITQAAGSLTSTMPAVYITDDEHTLYRFATIEARQTHTLDTLTLTSTVHESAARTVTRTERVTSALYTRTVWGPAQTVTRTWTMTVAPRCTYRH
ncbi:hypothetical protein V8E36_008329 [Tilletia maclaganii]